MFESRRKANAERKDALIAAIIFAFLGIVMVLFGVITSSRILIWVAVACFVFFVIAGLSSDLGGSRTWGIGAEGEETVERYLGLLGDSYSVIHDVVLPNMRGNVDHVVLGSNGVFAIETKNHNGFITCSGDSWEQRKVGQGGTPYYGKIGCPSRQVKKYAITLRNLIQDKLGTNLYVNCAVVFTNKDAVLRIDNPTVAVLRPENLCQYIKAHHSEVSLRDKELRELEAVIQPYSRFH